MVDTLDDRFGAYAGRLSDLSKYKRDEPKRAWANLESLHNQAVSGALDDVSELKQARRDWNRNLKNTPMGIMASGVDLGANPFGAQDLYHDMSAQLSYDAPAAYDEMYPFQPGKLISGLAKNTLMGKIFESMGRERRVPENVLAMRERFPGIGEINELVPGGGIATFVPEYQRQKAVFDMNETIDEGEGIFGSVGRGDLPSAFDYEELRRKRRLPYKLEEVLRQIEEASIEEFGDDTKELPEDKKTELEALLLSPEFQALPQHEKERILLEDYGVEIKTGIQ